jgi:transcriptional regulator with XRE-family HTH domain
MTAHATGDRQGPPTGRPRPAAAAPEQALNPLQRLIQQRLRERGWSYGEIARRGGLPRSTVYTLATTRNLARPPRPATIDALARGLDVPVSAVRAAAAESTGLHYYDQAPAGQEHPGDQGQGAPDRQHRRADARGPASRGRAGRIAAEQGVAGPGRPVAPAPGTAEISAVPGRRAHPEGTGHPCSTGQLAGTPSWSASSP